MTIDKIKEKYLSTVLTVLAVFLNYKLKFSLNIDMLSFSEKSIDISSISFGFLLAVLALLLQSDSTALQRIKSNGRFDGLINLNKKAVIASAILAVVALLYISLRPCITCINNEYLCLIFDCIVIGAFIFQIIEVFLFLDLFYYIIKW